jgi:hypothetical protein
MSLLDIGGTMRQGTKGWLSLLILAWLSLAVVMGVASWLLGINRETLEVRDHAMAVVGLPAAAVAAFTLVMVLERSSGPIEFNAAGINFKGAASQITLWLICFLAIAVAIKLLW